MKHYGDITKIDGGKIEIVDCICGGSPCQDLSIAGNRAGLSGERSSLFLEQIRIVKEMREHDRQLKRTNDDFRLRPRYMVWENVPGAFSSNGGKDFQTVLTEVIRIADPDAPEVPLPDKGKWDKSGGVFGRTAHGGYFSVCWRLHDAQFWGVPQRRKRISLVADFGGLTAPEICFIRKGLFGDTQEGGETWEETAGGVRDGVESAISGETIAIEGNGIRPSHNGDGYSDNGVMYTLNGTEQHAVYDARGNGDGKTVPTLTGDHGSRITDYTAICIGNGQGHMFSHISEEVAGSLNTMHDAMAILRNRQVRRLTPLECDRLQGFPDGWTDIGDWTDSKGKKRSSSDRLRYRALGNSVALPYWFWLLRRISAQYERPATLGSLFDGIGGFPLCWERCNGKGTAIWASEIEDFPIAVTKKHFPEEDEDR